MLATTIVALCSSFLTKLFGKKAGWILALGPASLAIASFDLFRRMSQEGPFSSFASWLPDIGFNIAFHIDGLGLLMSMLICGIGTFILIYGGGYLKGHEYLGRFFVCIQLFLVAMVGVVFSDNIILLFIFWELTSLTSFMLIGFSHDKQESRMAALHALLVTGAGGLCLLVGLVILGLGAGTFEISEMIRNGYQVTTGPYGTAAFILIILGAFTKSAQFPFHFWLPGAMAAPTPVSAYLHSATMVKAGIFLLARFQPILSPHEWWTFTLMTFGAITMLWGAFLAIKKNDLKQILAYTTLSVLGLLTVLLAFPTPYAATAFAYVLLAHAMYKGTLFMVAGIVDHQTGTRDVTKLSGLFRSLPFTGISVALATIAMAGIIPTLSFIGKEIALEGLLKEGPAGAALATMTAMASVAFTFVALIFVWTFFANLEDKPKYKEGYPSLLIGPLCLSVLGIVLGVAFPLTQSIVHTAMVPMLGDAAYPDLALWHGINLPLMMSLGSVALGIVFFISVGKKPWSLGEESLRHLALAPRFEAVYQKTLKLALKGAGILQHGHLRYYMRTTVIGTAALVILSLVVNQIPMPETDFKTLYWHEVAVFLIIAIAAIAATMVRSRLATIACLGIIGFMIAATYVMFSAPDLAMTQVLVETLTVILFALVIYKLPAYERLSSKGTVTIDAIISIVFGAMFTLLVLASSTTRWAETISVQHGDMSWVEAYGRNVVNVILVDFRALDTMGELAVLGIAAVGVFALLKYRRKKKEPML